MTTGCAWSITRTVAPTQMPVTLDDVKDRLRISGSDSDGELLISVNAATDYCQEYQWAQYCTATFSERFDRFPSEILLRRSPVQSVSSVAYVDTAGSTQTLVANTDYTVDIYSKPARIVPAYGKFWPSTRGHVNDVTVTYVGGYGTAADVPDEIRMAVMLKTAQLYEECGDYETVERAIHSMLDKRSFRVFW